MPFHTNQFELGKRHWNLETSSAVVEFPPLCGVSLKDRKHSVDLYSLQGVQSVADVVRHGRLKWIGHLEHRSVNDWVSACRKVEVAGARCKGRKRKTWYECVEDEVLGLHPEWAVFRDIIWRDLIWANV